MFMDPMGGQVDRVVVQAKEEREEHLVVTLSECWFGNHQA